MNSKSFTTAALAALTSASLLLNARADITTGLVGYWSLAAGPGSSTVVDLSGNGNTGTLTNYTDATYKNMWTTNSDPTNGWPYALKFTNSLAGFGTNTYVVIPDSTSLDSPTANKAWTVAAWVNCSVAGGSELANAGIVCKGNSGLEAYSLYMSGGHFVGDQRNAAGSGGQSVSSTITPAAGTWYHVVATFRTGINPQMYMYINGVYNSVANSNTYTTVYSTSLPVTIGCRAGTTGAITNAFLGTIDEVRIYNRVLATNDIFQLYTNKAYTPPQGIGYWNGLAGSGGNATLDTTSLNFCTNLYTAPLGNPDTLADLLNVEHAASQPLACFFGDSYYNSGNAVVVTSTNLNIASGGVALGTANGAGTVNFVNNGVTYHLNSTDANGLKDGANPTFLAQSGFGTVILTGTNTFSGGTTISSGTVQVGNGSGGAPTGLPLGSGPVTDNTNAALVFDANDSPPAFNNTISGSGTVTMSGSGTVTLTGASTYTGATVLNRGTLSVSSVGDSGSSSIGTGSVTLSGGTLAYTGTGDTTARAVAGGTATSGIDVPSGVNLTLNGAVAGTSGFTINKTSAGTLTLGGAADNAWLAMNISAGTVVLNKTSYSNVHALGNDSTVSGGTLQLSGSGGDQIANPRTITVSSGVFDLNGQSETINILNLSGTGFSNGGALINSAASTTSTLTCSSGVILAANSSIGGSGNITLPGAISGLGMSLTYAGTGTLTLSAANTYTGGTIINSGILDGSVAGSIPGNVTVNGTGVLELDNNTAMSSVATLTLPASPSAPVVNLTFSGTPQTIGILMIGSVSQPAGTYGASANNPGNTFTGPGLLNVTGQADWDPGFADASPGSGGPGSWNTGTANWFTGSADTAWPTDAIADFAKTAGTVTLAASVSADGLTFTTAGYTITNTDGVSILTLDGNNPTINVPSGNATIECTLAESGSSAVTVNGPGTLTLSGTNTYAGGTTINGATLRANTIADANCSIGPSGAVTFFGGGTLSYIGSGPAITTRPVTASGSTNVNVLNVPAGSLEVDGQITCSSATSFSKTGAGTLILGGAGDNSGLSMAINQGEVIIAKTSSSSVHGLGGGASSVAGGAELQLGGSGGFDLSNTCTLAVSSGGLFDLGGQSESMSTLTLSGAGPGGNGALINSSATASSLTNAGSGVVLAANTTIGGSGNITLASVVGGGYALTYAGSGTLTLSAANTYSGGTTINTNGTVLLTNSASAAGTGTITDNGTLGVAIVGNNIILPNAISGPGIVNMIQTTGDNLQLGGSMSGFAGTLNCLASPGGNAKCQILTTGVGLTSAATVNIAAGGTLYVANAGVTIPCPVNIYGLGNNETYGALRLESGALVSGPVTLYGSTTIGGGGTGTGTISGAINDGGHGYAVTKTVNTGTIALSGSNTFSGGITISGGLLSITGAGDLGDNGSGSGFYAGAITNNSAFNYASSAAQTLSGVISGTGFLAQSGPGVLTLSGTNTYTGGTLIANGAKLVIDDNHGAGDLGDLGNGSGGSYAGAITNYGSFVYASSAAQTLSGAISGTGTLAQRGSGTLTLSGANTYSGATVISNGTTLVLGSGGSINSTPSISLAEGATLDVSAYSAYSLLSSIKLSASGAGTTAGSTAATIKGAASNGATVTLGGPLALTFTPTAFSGDTTHPALYISQISAGELVLSGSTITVSNAAATPLGAGTYSLVQVAPGGVISLGTPAVTVTGLASGTTNSLSVSGGSLNLVVVSTVVPVPAINSFALSGTNLIFSGTNGPNSGTFHVLTSTNVALPLSNWTSIATGAFSPTGTFSVTNAVGVNPSQFFLIEVP
jgi:autotransporter-associated beta strand protein